MGLQCQVYGVPWGKGASWPSRHALGLGSWQGLCAAFPACPAPPRPPGLSLSPKSRDACFILLGSLPSSVSDTLTHITGECLLHSSRLGRACWLRGCHHRGLCLGGQTGNGPSQRAPRSPISRAERVWPFPKRFP